MYIRYLVLTGCLILLAAGCSTTTQIQTGSPQPALPSPSATPETNDLARLTITLEAGETVLSEDIEAMQFRIAAVHLKPVDGDWTVYPAGVNTFEIPAGRRARKTVLSTQIPPAAYDSLRLELSDVFVFYDANAGGPLTMPRDTPLTLGLSTRLTTEQPTTLRLVFEPGASLSHDAACRWFFLPFFEVHTE